ncbi:MAG: hypothetical protein ACRETU_12990 [Steroidobacterales bacterium]
MAFQQLSGHFGLATKAAVLQERVLTNMIAAKTMLAAASIDAALGVLRATTAFTLLVVLRFVLRNNRAAVAVLILIFSTIFVTYGVRATWLELGINLILNCIAVFVFVQYGFVATIVALTFALMLGEFPWTTDLSTWFAPQTIMGWGIVAVILGYGFLTAVGGRSLFRDPLSDPVTAAPRR